MAQISITRALSQLKMLDKRIEEKTNAMNYITMTRGRGAQIKVVNSNNTVDYVKEQIKSNAQQLNDLVVQRRVLKSAVMSSNASTTVVIAGEEYLVTDAIEYKNSIKYEINMLNKASAQFRQAITHVEAQNNQLNAKIETAVTQAYNNDKGKVTEDQYAAVANPRKDEGEYALLDPLDLENTLQVEFDKVNTFLNEIDFVLSESNARTMIEVNDA